MMMEGAGRLLNVQALQVVSKILQGDYCIGILTLYAITVGEAPLVC